MNHPHDIIYAFYCGLIIGAILAFIESMIKQWRNQ